MDILNGVLSLIPIKRKPKKVSVVKEVMNSPELFTLTAFVDKNEEIVIKIRKRNEYKRNKHKES